MPGDEPSLAGTSHPSRKNSLYQLLYYIGYLPRAVVTLRVSGFTID